MHTDKNPAHLCLVVPVPHVSRPPTKKNSPDAISALNMKIRLCIVFAAVEARPVVELAVTSVELKKKTGCRAPCPPKVPPDR